MKHIVFISSIYPSKCRPSFGTFVQQLIYAIARMGIKCSVISPVSFFHLKYGKFDPIVSYDKSISANPIKIIRPRHISFGSKNLFSFNTAFLTQMFFEQSVVNALDLLDEEASILYGHFLYKSGAAAVRIASKLDIPSCVAVGESSFWSIAPIGFQKATQDFEKVTGIISVSSSMKKALVEKLNIPINKIAVFPNGVDLLKFKQKNQQNLRNKFGFPENKFIIAFTGHFDNRKGAHRVLSAVSDIDNIGLIFIGNGPISLDDPKILFKGVLDHSMIPDMLSTADAFVLPTLAEGSCNAIIEALACGLPVITSNGDFNDDIIDDDISIRVNPLDINELKNAIEKLISNHKMRKEMSIKALEKAKSLDIKVRALGIVDWLTKLESSAVNNN